MTYQAERKGAVEYALREGFVEGSFFEQPVVSACIYPALSELRNI